MDIKVGIIGLGYVGQARGSSRPGRRADEPGKALRRHGLMTRDARIKESKKYGLKRARRAPQYTKR